MWCGFRARICAFTSQFGMEPVKIWATSEGVSLRFVICEPGSAWAGSWSKIL